MDNGSAYTDQLAKLLEGKNISFERKTPDTLDLSSLDVFDSIILSGRKKNSKRTNQINSKIILHAISNNKKLFGICYGAEILALTLGGTIKKSSRLQKGNQTVTIHRTNSLCNNKINVFESHEFEIAKLPKELISLANSDNCKHEIIQYYDRPIFGTQFHPEMSIDGHKLIERFYNL